MKREPIIYICYVDHKGFVNYDPMNDVVRYVQYVNAASESPFRDWQGLIDAH